MQRDGQADPVRATDEVGAVDLGDRLRLLGLRRRVAATPRLIVSPVDFPSCAMNGCATATRLVSAPPRQAKLTNISPGKNRP